MKIYPTKFNINMKFSRFTVLCSRFTVVKLMYLNDLEQAMFGIIDAVREGLLLQVVGVDNAERHLTDLLHQFTDYLHSFLNGQ